MVRELTKSDGIDYFQVLNNKTILPSTFFAPISYYSILLNLSDIVIEIHENYIKQSIRNRCSIYSANGILNLSVPKIRKNSSKTKIKDVKICYAEPWQKIHWKTIVTYYNSSPFFDFYRDRLEKIYFEKEKFLIDLNHKTLCLILEIFKVKKNISFSDNYEKLISPKDFRSFSFLTDQKIYYDQVYSVKHGFINNLSILDLLFNLGPESTDIINKINISKIY